MTERQKRKAEIYLDNLYFNAVKTWNKSNEGLYVGARNLIGSLGLLWHRDKAGKHHIF